MSMPPTAVLSGLSTIVSFMLAHSTVQVEGTQWREPVILWLTIGMPTASSKSSLFHYFFELLRSTRSKCNRKDIHPSWTVEESSFEKMGLLMSNNDAKLLVWIQSNYNIICCCVAESQSRLLNDDTTKQS